MLIEGKCVMCLKVFPLDFFVLSLTLSNSLKVIFALSELIVLLKIFEAMLYICIFLHRIDQ